MKILLVIMLLLPFFGSSQNWKDSIPIDEKNIVKYEYIFEPKGTKENLFAKSKIWLMDISDEFYESKLSIQTEDKEEGYLIVKLRTLYRHDYYTYKKKKVLKGEELWTDPVQLTLKCFVKDNKVKIIITDIIFEFANIPALNETYDMDKIEKGLKLLSSQNQQEQAEGLTWKEKFIGIHKKVASLAISYNSTLTKKSDNEF